MRRLRGCAVGEYVNKEGVPEGVRQLRRVSSVSLRCASVVGIRCRQETAQSWQHPAALDIRRDVWQPILCTVCVFFHDLAVAWVGLLLGF